MSTHTHVIEVEAHADFGELESLSGVLRDLLDEAGRVNSAFKDLGGVRVSVDASSSLRELEELESAAGRASSALEGVSGDGLRGVGGGADDASKSFEAAADSASELSGVMKDVDGDVFNGIASQVDNARREVEGLAESIGDLHSSFTGIRFSLGSRIGTQAGDARKEIESLTDSVYDLQSALNGVDGGGLENIGGSASKGGSGGGQTYRDYATGYGRRMGSVNMVTGTGILSYLVAGSALSTIVGTSSQKEVNRITSRQAGYNYDLIDTTTDTSLTSMQDLIPAMYQFQAESGATADEMNYGIKAMAKFGAKIQSMGYSSEIAETAMGNLSKGLHGAFESINDFGITENVLREHGWSGEESDITGYFDAVDSALGDTEEYMDTFEGAVTQLGKHVNSAAGQLGESTLPFVKNLIQAYNAFDDSLGRVPTKLFLVGSTIASSLKPVSDFVWEFRQMAKGVTGLADVFSTLRSARSLTNGSLGSGLKAVLKGTSSEQYFKSHATPEEVAAREAERRTKEHAMEESTHEFTVSDEVEHAMDKNVVCPDQSGMYKDVPDKSQICPNVDGCEGLQHVQEDMEDVADESSRTTKKVKHDASEAEKAVENSTKTSSHGDEKSGTGRGVIRDLEDVESTSKRTRKGVESDIHAIENSLGGSTLSDVEDETRSAVGTASSGLFTGGRRVDASRGVVVDERGLTSRISKSLRSVGRSVSGVATTLGSTLSGYISSGFTGVSTIFSSLSSGFTRLGSSITGVFRGVSSSVGSCMKGVTTSLKGLRSSTLRVTSSIRNSFVGMGESIASSLGLASEEVATSVAVAESGTVKSSKKQGNSINKTSTKTRRATSRISGGFRSAGSSITSGIFSLRGAVLALGGVTVAAVAATVALHKLGFSWGDVWSMMKNGDMSQLTDKLNESIQGLSQRIGSIDWKNTFGNIFSSIGQVISGVNWVDLGKSLLKGVGGLAEGLAVSIGDIDFEQAGKDIMHGIGDLATSTESQEMEVSVGTLIVDLTWDALELGAGVLEGLWDEIYENVHDRMRGEGATSAKKSYHEKLDNPDYDNSTAKIEYDAEMKDIGTKHKQDTSYGAGAELRAQVKNGTISVNNTTGTAGENFTYNPSTSSAPTNIFSDIWQGIKSIFSGGSKTMGLTGTVNSGVGGDIMGATAMDDKLAEEQVNTLQTKQDRDDSYASAMQNNTITTSPTGETPETGEAAGAGEMGIDTAQLTALQEALTNINTAVTMANEGLSTFSETFTTLGTSVSTLNEAFTTLNEAFTTFSTTLTPLNEALTTFSTTFTTVNESLTLFSTTLTTLNESLLTFSETFTTINESLVTFSTTFTTINEDMTLFSTSLTTVNTNLTTFNETLTLLAPAITTFSTNLAMLNPNLLMFSQDLASVLPNLLLFSTTMTLVGISSSLFSANMASISASLSNLSATLSDVTSKLNTFKDTMSTIGTDMISSFRESFSGLSDVIAEEMDGAKATLESKGDELVATARSIGQQMGAALREGMDVGSPGTIWTTIREEMEGSVGELESSVSPLTSASYKAGQGVAEGFTRGNTGSNPLTLGNEGIGAPLVELPEKNVVNTTSRSDHDQSGETGDTVIHNWNITGEFDSDKRVQELVSEVTKALTFDNNRAGRNTGTLYKG